MKRLAIILALAAPAPCLAQESDAMQRALDATLSDITRAMIGARADALSCRQELAKAKQAQVATPTEKQSP